MKVSGEGTAEGPDESVSFNEYKSKGDTAQDVRFTLKGDALYAFVLGVPTEKMVIKSLALKKDVGKIASVDLVGSAEKAVWSQSAKGLTLQPAKRYPAECAAAYRIMFSK